jgi:hypothetical protein
MPEDFGQAVKAVRRIITGETKEYGLLVWFKKEMDTKGYESPTTATIHRWVKGENNPSEEGLEMLSDLKKKARTILRGDLKQL